MLRLKKAGTLAIASLMVAGGIMGGATSVLADTTDTQGGASGNDPDTTDVPVAYDNRNVIPDQNGTYGMIIPTGITFTDKVKTVDATVQIVGINGYNLDKDWTALDVTTSIKSKNGYKLQLGETSDPKTDVAYTLTMADQEQTKPFAGAGTYVDVTKHFGVGTGMEQKVEGTAKMTGSDKATKKGRYQDVLTYAFTENTNTPA